MKTHGIYSLIAATFCMTFGTAPATAQNADCLQQLRSLDHRLERLDDAGGSSTKPIGGIAANLPARDLQKVERLYETAEVLYYAGRNQACIDTVVEAKKMLKMDQRLGLISVNRILGYQVKNTKGVDLGEIHDVILDVNEDHIAYVIVEFGGFLGMGENLSPVPFSALVPSITERAFVLAITEAKLEKAPRFTSEKMPDMNDPAWGKSIFSYYGRRPYWDTQMEANQSQ